MTVLVTRLQIAAYEPWKEAFDRFEPQRRQAGLTNARVFRSETDGHDIVVMFDVPDEGTARSFLGNEQLRDAMQKAGVTGRPQSGFLT
jgi:hypothetical protein